jgi:hypothetical protein
MLLDSETLNDPLVLYEYNDQFYGTLPNIKKNSAYEILVGINEIETMDDIFGFTDSTNVTEFLSISKGLDF